MSERSGNPSSAFDNTRFFAAKSRGGVESGWDGWLRITVEGRRRFVQHIDPLSSALLVIDMHAECCDEWPAAIARLDPELASKYETRINGVVVPNIVRLLDLFRRHDLPIIYFTLAQDSVVEALRPAPERMQQGNWWSADAREFILQKFSSGAFATSAIDNVLKELGVATIFCTGTDTCGCVDATMTEAYDRTYQTILVDDACCSSRPELHDAAVAIWAYKGFVRTTEQVVGDYPWACWIDPELAGSPESTIPIIAEEK